MQRPLLRLFLFKKLPPHVDKKKNSPKTLSWYLSMPILTYQILPINVLKKTFLYITTQNLMKVTFDMKTK